jgi:hypothetical protein
VTQTAWQILQKESEKIQRFTSRLTIHCNGALGTKVALPFQSQESAMTDDKTQLGPADQARINVHEDHEVQYWAKKFGCTRAELEEAVRTVGVMASEVEAYFWTRR